MAEGTGLDRFAEAHPDRFFDVGIAEQHAVTFAGGLALEGGRPVVAIYSTFLQRAFDQLVHDIALQSIPVVFCLDRAGLVGEDGPTHHGDFDLSYLLCIPGMVVSAPRDGEELRDLLYTALAQDTAPFAIRYPRESIPAELDPDREPALLDVGSWETLREGDNVALLAVGAMVEPSLRAAEILAGSGVSATVVNCRFVKPMDTGMLQALAGRHQLMVTVEENAILGGFGACVIQHLAAADVAVWNLGLADRFYPHGPRTSLLEQAGLSPGRIAEQTLEALQSPRVKTLAGLHP
jgi:1-deoxy-D-xylulose-5-phosphate synthase